MGRLAAAADNGQAPRGPLTRRGQVAEMLVVLSLVLPPAVVAPFAYSQWQPPFALAACGRIAHGLPLTALLLFLLWRNGEPRRSIGWQLRWQDVGLAVLLYVPYEVTMSSLLRLFGAAGPGYVPIPAANLSRPMGAAEVVLCVAAAAIAAVWEELFFRGYLLLRLRGVGASALVPLVASAALFALGHAYQGPLGVATAGVAGLLWGLIYLWRKNLTAPMVLHFLDIVAAYAVVPAFLPGRWS